MNIYFAKRELFIFVTYIIFVNNKNVIKEFFIIYIK